MHARTSMRFVLGLVLVLGALGLVAALAAWLAERSLEWSSAARIVSDPAALPAGASGVEAALVLGAAPIGPEGGPNRYFEYRLDAVSTQQLEGSEPQSECQRPRLTVGGIALGWELTDVQDDVVTVRAGQRHPPDEFVLGLQSQGPLGCRAA